MEDANSQTITEEKDEIHDKEEKSSQNSELSEVKNEVIKNPESEANSTYLVLEEEDSPSLDTSMDREREDSLLQELLEPKTSSWEDLVTKFDPQSLQIQVLWDKIIGLEAIKRKLKAYLTALDSEIEGYIPEELDTIFGKRGKILFYGSPGTGKMMLARAIGGLLERTSYEVKINRLGISKNTQLERLKTLIKGLQEHSIKSPSILILDNFQALAIQPNKLTREEYSITVAFSEILELISYTHEKLLIIAITTDPEVLMPQIWQMFDLHIELTLPDLRTRRHILRNLLTVGPTEINLSELAAQTEGFSYVDLQHLVWNAIVEKLAERSATLEEKHLEKALLSMQGIGKIQYKAAARQLSVGEALERISRTSIDQFDPYMIIINDPSLSRTFIRLYKRIRENKGTLPTRSLDKADNLFINAYKAFFTEKGGQIGLTANAESLFLALDAKKS